MTGPTINEADLDFLRAGEEREQDDLFDDEDLDRQNAECDEAAEEDLERDDNGFYVTFTED